MSLSDPHPPQLGQDDIHFQFFWKYLLVISFGILASLFLFVAAMYLLVKIYRIVHFKGDPALILSITSISLALACMFTYDSLDMIRILSFDKDLFIHFEIHSTLVNEIDQMKVMFLFLSLVFDVYKWSIFLASTGVQNSPTFFEDR
jgi:hypothetical protein